MGYFKLFLFLIILTIIKQTKGFISILPWDYSNGCSKDGGINSKFESISNEINYWV